jgi:CheY-like chemotaxis protein
MRILYVEDNPANLFLIKRVAKMGDHEVINLIDGEEALRKIDLIKPDLILMDIQLAGQLTGLDVVRKLRQDGLTVPIVAVTAYAMVGDRERCLEAGCNEYLSKPLPIGRVVELLQLYQSGVPVKAQKESDEVYLPIDRSAETPAPAAETPVEAAPAATATPAETAPAAPTPPAETAPAVAVTPAATPDAAVATPVPSETVEPAAPSAPAAPVAQEEPTLPAPPEAPPTQPSAPASSEAAPKAEVSSDSAASPTPSVPHGADTSAPIANSPADVTGEPLTQSGTDELSDPAVESTSQDTSHPQDTVQAQ